MPALVGSCRRWPRLLHHLQTWAPPRWWVRSVSSATWLAPSLITFARYGHHGHVASWTMKCHPLPVLFGENASHSGNRHRHFPRDAIESRRELDQIIPDLQIARCVSADVENDLAIAHKLQRNTRVSVDFDGDIRGETVVLAPLANGPNQIRCRGRRSLHLRITFSEGVNASINAGRLKIRSAYFINGAACFGN